ncbi:hypothetical protein CBL_01304 [Carabus blaptoides fortunei]
MSAATFLIIPMHHTSNLMMMAPLTENTSSNLKLHIRTYFYYKPHLEYYTTARRNSKRINGVSIVKESERSDDIAQCAMEDKRSSQCRMRGEMGIASSIAVSADDDGEGIAAQQPESSKMRRLLSQRSASASRTAAGAAVSPAFHTNTSPPRAKRERSPVY